MRHRVLSAALGALLFSLASPNFAAAQQTSPDTLDPMRAVRPMAAVVVTARRESAFESAMSRLGLRASITAKQRENRRLSRQLAAYDRIAFGLERKLDSLMVVATIQELNIARTDSATASLRSRRLRLEALLCESAPAECNGQATVVSATKGD